MNILLAKIYRLRKQARELDFDLIEFTLLNIKR